MNAKKIAILAVLLALTGVVLISGCVDTGKEKAVDEEGKTYTQAEDNKAYETKALKSYGLGQTFTAGGNLRFTVDKVEKKELIKHEHCVEAMGGDCRDYKPKNGVYLIVYLTFQGSTENEVAGYNVDVIRLLDIKGRTYENIEPNGAIDEWRAQTKVPNLSFAMLNNPEKRQYMEIYDIPKDAGGLKLQWLIWKDKKVQVEAEVNL